MNEKRLLEVFHPSMQDQQVIAQTEVLVHELIAAPATVLREEEQKQDRHRPTPLIKPLSIEKNQRTQGEAEFSYELIT